LGILRDMNEVFRGLKRRKSTSELCPVCGSPKLRLSSRFDSWLIPVRYICENCGYKGSIMMEKEESSTDQKRSKSKNR
jgi:C4-type Zn-finger protein